MIGYLLCVRSKENITQTAVLELLKRNISVLVFVALQTEYDSDFQNLKIKILKKWAELQGCDATSTVQNWDIK